MFKNKPNDQDFQNRGIPIPIAIKIKDPELIRILQTEDADQLLSNFKTFRDSCTDLIFDYWRLSKTISKLRNAEDLAVVSDALERFRDTLKKQGFEVKDMIGNSYNDGLIVDVIHVEEVNDPKVKAAFISETIRPAIYLNNRLIQKSEVVVTKPATN